jgi:putative transposase
MYYYKTVDKQGNTLDFMLSEHLNEDAANRFFKQVIDNNGLPSRVVIDKSEVNRAE